MPSIFVEKESRICQYLRFADAGVLVAVSAQTSQTPNLTHLRVELERSTVGMKDFIVRVATPKYASIKSNTVLSIRGDDLLSKFDQVRKLSELVGAEMIKHADKTFVWANLDADHLANMLASPLKYFATNRRLAGLKFTTEALA